MTAIRVTIDHRAAGTAYIFDATPSFSLLEFLYPDASSITRTNAGWSVDIGAAVNLRKDPVTI